MNQAPRPNDDPVAIEDAARIDLTPRGAHALPGPRRLVATTFEFLRRSAPEVRRGALAVGLQFLGLLGPVLVLVAVALARLPDPMVLFGDGPPPTSADAELAGFVGLGILIAVAGGAALVVESRAIGLVVVASAALGRPVTLAAALRRSRQTFWRLVALSLAVELPLGILGSLVGDLVAGPSAGGQLLAAAVGFLLVLVLQAPIVYAAAGIVVAGLGLRAALGTSVRLAATAPRLVLAVLAVGGAAQLLLVLALNGGLDVLAVVAELVGLGLGTDDPARTFATLAVLLGTSSVVGSLAFSVTCLAAAPQAIVVALAGPSRGLDQATAEAGAGPSRWLSLPMALGIATAVVISIVGIQNVLGRG